MGDISELRGIITIVSFTGIFVFLAMLIPINFFTFSPERQVDVPEHFEALDIQFFADVANFTVTHDPYFFDHTFGLGGWNLIFRSWKSYALVPVAEIRSYHYASWWIFAWNYKQFNWHDESGINYGDSLTFDQLDSIWNSQTETQKETQTMKFIIKTQDTQLTVFFGWNTTEYSKPSDALNDNAMDVLYAMSMDQVNTSMNLWSLIGMLVFFNIPDIHPALNIIIKIPFWVTTAYLVYVLAIKIIPFIAGG